MDNLNPWPAKEKYGLESHLLKTIFHVNALAHCQKHYLKIQLQW